MPTGYTNGVYTGEITELKEFVKDCAPAFGAFVHQRDEGGTTLRYPPRTLRESHYPTRLEQAKVRLYEWNSSSEEEKYAQWSEYVNDLAAARDAAVRNNMVVTDRYENMLAQVKSVDFPEELRNFHEFLQSQLEESLEYDTYSVERLNESYAPRNYSEWCDDTAESLSRDIEYNASRIAEESERYQKAVAYIDLLVETYGLEVEQP